MPHPRLRRREAYSYRRDSSVPRFDDSSPIVFMDGQCALCTRGAKLISRLDRRNEFRICPTDSALAGAVLSHYGLDAADPETWLLLEDGKAYASMEAIIRAGRRLGGLGASVQVLRILPGFLRDWLYRRLARNRYRLFGRTDMCAVPDAALRQRLLVAADLAPIKSAIAPGTHPRPEEPAPTLFQRALGEKWQELPPCVQRLHSVQDMESFSGQARVTRGRGPLARLAAWFFRFPREGDGVPLTITKTRTQAGEIWERNFAGRRFRSFLTPSVRPQHYCERFGPFTYEQELPIEDGVLHFPVRRGWLLGIPLPSPLLPGSCSREFAVNSEFHFDVGLCAPLTKRLIVRYRGSVRPDAA